jgi:multicomponent Na+:H+ antiporter subunit D
MRVVLLGLGILTAVVGAVMALAQIHLKRMLAFVTMSHMGIYLIGAGLLTPLGLAGASLLVIGDGLAKSALFLGVGVVQHQRASVSEIKLRGRGRGLAVTGVTITLGALVLADLPPYVSSAGHALLVKAAEQAGLPWIEIVIAVCVILSSGAVLRAAGRIWLGWGSGESSRPETGTADDPGEEAEDRSDTAGAEGKLGADEISGADGGQDKRGWSGRLRRVPLTMVLPPLALLAIGLGLGLTAGIEEHAAAAATAFSDRAAYAAAVLRTHGGSVPLGGRVVVPAAPAASAGDVLTDLGQALGALCVAGIALDRRAVGLRRALAAGTGWLRRLHSGLVGDQVTWLVAGLALLAALSEAALH